MYRGYVYNPPEDEMTDEMLSGYCVETSCYYNIVDNSTFTSDFCNPSYCEVENIHVPTLPDINNNHWFFDYFLYIGGVIHLLMSIVMATSYFVINARNFTFFILPKSVSSILFYYSGLWYLMSSNVFHYMYVYIKCYIKVISKFLCRYRSYDHTHKKAAEDTDYTVYTQEPLFGIRSLYHIVRINHK